MSKLKGLVSRARVLHYLDVFLAAFGMALLFNKDQILAAHGLNAWKSLVFAAAVVGGKAAFEAYRKAHPAPAGPPSAK